MAAINNKSEMSSSTTPRILVLGSGVVGLNTAIRLQMDYPQAEITIMADKFDSELVSYVAAGFFRASLSLRGPNQETTREWLKNAWYFYTKLKNNFPQQETGIVDVPAYFLSSKSVPRANLDEMKEFVDFVRECSHDELNLFLPAGKYVYGLFMTAMTISPDRYLNWAMKYFKKNNGIFVWRHIDSWDDLIGEPYDVIINCTGFGARRLCNDLEMAPLRGQVIRVKAPWIKFALYADNDTHIIPGLDYVTLGSIRQYDNFSQDICEHDSRGIWKRTTTLVPSLKKSQIVCEAVGIRPNRTKVRVEVEVIKLKGDQLQRVLSNLMKKILIIT